MAQKCQKCFFPSTYPTAAWAAVQCYGTLSPFFYFFIPPPAPRWSGLLFGICPGGGCSPWGSPEAPSAGPARIPPRRCGALRRRQEGVWGAGGRRSGPLFVVVGGALPAVRAGGKRGSNALGAEAPRACASPSPPSRGSGRLLVGLVPPFAPPPPPYHPAAPRRRLAKADAVVQACAGPSRLGKAELPRACRGAGCR